MSVWKLLARYSEFELITNLITRVQFTVETLLSFLVRRYSEKRVSQQIDTMSLDRISHRAGPVEKTMTRSMRDDPLEKAQWDQREMVHLLRVRTPSHPVRVG